MATSVKKTKEDKRLVKERENLLNNRRQRFRELFPDDWPNKEIESFARSSISPWDAKNLIDAGCPFELVSKILL